MSADLWGEDLSGSLQGAGGVGGLLAVTDDTATYFPMYDGNGNIMTYVDPSGTIKADYTFDPFGRTLSQSGTLADSFLYKFSTKRKDFLYDFGKRDYAADLGCWISKDPIGENGGANLYGFVGNNSISRFDYLGMILVAVDGTSSGSYLKSASKTKTGLWYSHVRNFYNDTTDSDKLYSHGPDSAATGADSTAMSKQIKEWICKKWCKDQKKPIDLIGHSRGGFIALTIARKLQSEGCCDKDTGKLHKPVRIRFLGLYDAVDMVVGYGEGESISSNVAYAAHAMSDPKLKSRRWFNTADGGADDLFLTQYSEVKFWATHSGIGGAPWKGDAQDKISEQTDIFSSINADQFVRTQAIKAGVKVKRKGATEYGY